MPRVEISINHRKYPIVCDTGQESRVRELAAFIDKKAQEIASAAPGSSESVVMTLTTLMVADELFEQRRINGNGEGGQAASAGLGFSEQDQQQALEAVEYLRKRVAAIADSLQDH